jgi:hypothetical protein
MSMGAVASDEKHVVTVELQGPKPEAEYNQFVAEMKALTDKYGARVIRKERVAK